MASGELINQWRLLPFLTAEIIGTSRRRTVDGRIAMLISVLLKKQCTEHVVNIGSECNHRVKGQLNSDEHWAGRSVDLRAAGVKRITD